MKPRTIVSRVVGLSVALALAPAALRAAPEMKRVAEVAPEDGVIHEAFGFADGGARLAYARTDPNGKTYLHVGPPGGKTSATDISSFSHEPEKILFVAGHWFVVANEGSTRRAAVVGPTGRIENHVGPFGDCFVANLRGKTFATVTDKGETAAGHAYSIAAYRPNGAPGGSKLVTIGPNGTMAGTDGLVFVAFTGGYLQALVKKAGRYDAKADVRGGTDIAVLDVLSGKTGPAKKVTDIRAFLTLADKRGEKPGQEAFVRVDDDGGGLELVGPGDKLRPLALPTKFSLYEAASLKQQPSAGQLFFSLTVDPLNPDQVAAQKKGTRVLHLFEAGLGAAKATLLGQVALDDDTQTYSWAAGGNKLAIVKRARASGRNEIVIYAR
jgi:hypothetical protein